MCQRLASHQRYEASPIQSKRHTESSESNSRRVHVNEFYWRCNSNVGRVGGIVDDQWNACRVLEKHLLLPLPRLPLKVPVVGVKNHNRRRRECKRLELGEKLAHQTVHESDGSKVVLSYLQRNVDGHGIIVRTPRVSRAVFKTDPKVDNLSNLGHARRHSTVNRRRRWPVHVLRPCRLWHDVWCVRAVKPTANIKVLALGLGALKMCDTRSSCGRILLGGKGVTHAKRRRGGWAMLPLWFEVNLASVGFG